MTALVAVKTEEGDYAYDIVEGETPYNHESLLTWLCLSANTPETARSFVESMMGVERVPDLVRIVEAFRRSGVEFEFVYTFDDGWWVNVISASGIEPPRPAMDYLVQGSRPRLMEAWLDAASGNVQGVSL